jgi:hypothetical protein
MTALSKFPVLLALFLSTSHANALSSVAGNQVWVIHLIRLQQPMSNSTNEPSCEPILPNNLSPKNTQVAYSEPKQDAELPSKITDSTITQPHGLCHGKKSELESLAEQPVAATNSFQNTLPAALDLSASSCGLCHGKKSELESLAEKPIAATDRFQNTLPAALDLSASSILPAALDPSANPLLSATLDSCSARPFNLSAGLGLRLASTTNLSAALDLHSASVSIQKRCAVPPKRQQISTKVSSQNCIHIQVDC